jgi:hypothetical protein
MEKKYKVEIMATHIERVWANDENEAKELAQSKVFEEKINHKAGDLITGYKVIEIK